MSNEAAKLIADAVKELATALVWAAWIIGGLRAVFNK